MTIHVAKRGSKRSWVLIWALLVFCIVAVGTGYFGLAPTP